MMKIWHENLVTFNLIYCHQSTLCTMGNRKLHVINYLCWHLNSSPSKSKVNIYPHHHPWLFPIYHHFIDLVTLKLRCEIITFKTINPNFEKGSNKSLGLKLYFIYLNPLLTKHKTTHYGEGLNKWTIQKGWSILFSPLEYQIIFRVD